SELYRQMPYREEILHGLLGADLVGFHTYDYVRHFHEAVRRILGHEHVYGQINLPNRTVRTDAFPISIDYQKYRDSGDIPEVKKYIDEFKARFGDKKIILSIDRLDYSKGIPNRLEAFNIFLEKYPEYLGKVYLIIGAVPSRTQVDTYEQLKERVDKLVGQINGKYGTLDWIPIHYMYRSLPFDKLTAVYNISDIAMITPIRDGMNLVAKEFVAAKKDGRGVLILSESAGASQELSEAIIINPNDYDSIAEALKQALVMPEEEQIQRNRPMQERIERYDINRWAHDFMERLRQEKIQQYALFSKNLVGDVKEELIQKYREAKSRLLMLDYDGTLVGFAKRPEDARPDEEVYKILSELAKNPRNNVVIVSGRNKDSLDRWFGNMDNISIIAEHGTWIKYPGENWETLEQISAEWKSEIKPILELFVDRTPGALLEEKDYSLVWHYRNVNPSLVPVRVNELKNILINFTGNLNIGMLDGNKVIEIKNTGINKGAAANKLMQMDSWEFVMAIGDDVTDEDMFKALPESSETIKVGFQRSHARFNLKTISEVRNLLNQLIKE
ncbi:MAG: bifunctional alpha,alpha-trehalose-phosphate synthase (UDP-forming)/trehalose-phosphatase, partial [Bacteroidota bacterium]